MQILRSVLLFLDAAVVSYFLAYMLVNLVLLLVSSGVVRRSILLAQLLRRRATERFAPLITLIVPAYNEEVTLVESLRSLLRLRYPRFEIVVVNDGSNDRTLEVVRDTFAMVRSDTDYDPHLGTMPIRGFYRATCELPPSAQRLLLVDKENGGKADAINAGLNASQGSYVTTMDADSLLVDDALSLALQPVLDDPNSVLACGGQIALSNGCRVEGGRVVEVRLPKRWIARFQVVEYMRSFTQSRTGLGRFNALLILSGVFAVFQREALLAAGGFLSKHMRSRVGLEYASGVRETVCEDMEVVVRLHRYAIDHQREARIEILPFPCSWTEAPESWRDLGKQRNRWYRGLLEVLWINRGMLLRRRYGRIGLFSLPYQLLFEALAPIIEALGYLVLPLSWVLGILDGRALLAFVAFALSFNMLLSVGSVLLAIWRVRSARLDLPAESLLAYRGFGTTLRLVFSGLLSNFGYRQYLLAWQLVGLRDYIAGRKGWDKFARRGFKAPK